MAERSMEYLDFELEIGTGQGRDYPVEVVHSPAGERRATMHFPFDELELENHLLRVQNALLQTGSTRRRIASPADQAVEEFGQALFEALITSDIRACYELSRHEAQQQSKGLRIKLRVQDPMLASLPWEFLYDARQGEFMALSRYTPIVRYLDLPRAIQPLPVAAPLQILGMVASPDDLPPLNVERERQRVDRAVADIRAAGLVEVTWLDGGSWQDLQRAMRRGPWHIFHFVGHGRFDAIQDEGVVALVGEDGATDELTASQIGRLLADHPSLRLVMLNACEGAKGGKTDIFSGTAATLVRRGIPAVVAMQYEITDRAAIEFARTFYEAVSDDMPLDAAVSEARKAVSVSINNTVEWGTPVLYMRSPDGVLFRVDRNGAAKRDVAVPVDAPSAARDKGPEAYDPVAFEAELRRRWEAEEQRRNAAAEAAAAEAKTAADAEAQAEADRQALAEANARAKAEADAHAQAEAQAQADARARAQTATAAPAQPPTPDSTTLRSSAPAAAPSPAPVPPSSTAQPLQFTVVGKDGELLVSRDWVGIRRPPPKGPDKRRPDRLEPLARLAVVHVISGQDGGGFIQLCYREDDPRPITFWTADRSPSTILFHPYQRAQFVSAKQWLDYYMALLRRG